MVRRGGGGQRGGTAESGVGRGRVLLSHLGVMH